MEDDRSLRAAFLAARRDPGPPPDEAELDAALAEALARGRAAWPGVDVGPEGFAGFLAERVPPGPVAEALRALRVEDLHLTFACGHGDEAALEAFERTFLPVIARAVRRLSPDPDFGAEIQQRVRTHLLVARDEGAPRVLEYQGRGSLGGWVRMVGVRLALQLLRGARREERRAGQLADEPGAPRQDVELELLRDRFREPFKRAFEVALGILSADERTMLQLHLVEGLSLGRIGALYRADKSTISRRMARARERVLETVYAELRASVPADEVDSLIGLLRSRLDLSLERLLAVEVEKS